jgi:hypothetical protein
VSAAATPVEEKKETTTPIKPTSHLFHPPCQPADGPRVAYCGAKLHVRLGPWDGQAEYETCVVCLEIYQSGGCLRCGDK